MKELRAAEVQVWDLFVRVFHWTLMAAFLVAYFVEAEDSTLALHVWAGYAVGGLVVLRILWGFIGPKHARFRDFLFGPFTALRYLMGLFGGSTKRYLGHSPAGAWMVFVLLVGLAVTVVSGMAVYGEEEGRGPLAPLFAAVEYDVSNAIFGGSAHADEHGNDRDEETGREGNNGEFFEELHDIFANLTLFLAILHVGGVGLASLAHRENLVRAMITGKKRAE